MNRISIDLAKGKTRPWKDVQRDLGLEPSQPPEHVQAWQVALGCEVNLIAGVWEYQYQALCWRPVPDRGSGYYFKAMVLAVTAKDALHIQRVPPGWYIVTIIGTRPKGEGPDQVSALIAAVLAGGGK